MKTSRLCSLLLHSFTSYPQRTRRSNIRARIFDIREWLYLKRFGGKFYVLKSGKWRLDDRLFSVSWLWQCGSSLYVQKHATNYTNFTVRVCVYIISRTKFNFLVRIQYWVPISSITATSNRIYVPACYNLNLLHSHSTTWVIKTYPYTREYTHYADKCECSSTHM